MDGTATYHLWTKRKAPAVVVGDRVRFEGSVRGYITKRPVHFTSAGQPSFRLRGDRRIAPGRHILEDAEGARLAGFKTRKMTSPLDTRGTSILDADGSELASLVVRGDRFRDRLRATVSDDLLLTADGQTVGSFGRCASTATAQPDVPGRCRRFLSCPADWDARIAAGILVYWLGVLEPSKSFG